MSAKHTPGPWSVRSDRSMDGDIVIVQQTQHDGIGYHIGEVWTVSGSPENEANARLIAAAPELLDALIQAQSLFQQINRDDGDEFKNLSCDGMDLLGPLIAPFTGAQP